MRVLPRVAGPKFAHRSHDSNVRDVQIALGDFELRVPEQHLDLANVEAIFKPPRRTLVPQVVPVKVEFLQLCLAGGSQIPPRFTYSGCTPFAISFASRHRREQPGAARTAVTFARDRNLERDAVVEERAILRDTLQRSLGEARVEGMKQEVDRRVERGEFVGVPQEPSTPRRSFTTPTMMELERETIDRMRAGQGRYAELVADSTREAVAREYDHLSESQRTAVAEILASRDQVIALEGTAGTGKTTALAAVRDAAEREGYQVEGFAPTSRAAHKLGEAGIESSTLQRHLVRGEEEAPPTDQKRLYVLDESSLASTTQMHTFLERLGPEDRAVLVGDVRQHEAVDAGRPYHQLH